MEGSPTKRRGLLRRGPHRPPPAPGTPAGGQPRQQATAADAAAPASLASLSDDALLRIFSAVGGTQQRQASLAAVCRRWRGLAASPLLLQSVDVSLGGGGGISSQATQGSCRGGPALAPPSRMERQAQAQADEEGRQGRFPQRLAAFVGWLQLRAAPHVRRLALRLDVPADVPGPATKQAMRALKAALVDSCPHLAELQFDVGGSVRASSWLAGLAPGLSCLRISSTEGLRFAAQLGGCGALRELALAGGGGLRVAAAALLPESLTALELCGSKDEELPPQLAALPRLRRLAVSRCGCTAPGFCLLAALGPSLEELELRHCDFLPAAVTFKALTALTSLGVHACSSDEFGAGGGALQGELSALLRRLPQLQRLAWSHPCQLPAFPPALEGLQQLARFEWGGTAPADPQLPAGRWLTRLLHVALPCDAAATSLSVLSAAWQLESVLVSGPFAVLGRTASGGGAGSGLSRAGSGSPGASPDAPSSCASTARPSAQLELVRWAARHPHLQRLALQLDAAALAADPGLATAVAEAKKLRPALHIALA